MLRSFPLLDDNYVSGLNNGQKRYILRLRIKIIHCPWIFVRAKYRSLVASSPFWTCIRYEFNSLMYVHLFTYEMMLCYLEWYENVSWLVANYWRHDWMEYIDMYIVYIHPPHAKSSFINKMVYPDSPKTLLGNSKFHVELQDRSPLCQVSPNPNLNNFHILYAH